MVDKRLILAVAGSGKTRLLIDSLNENENFIIVTYTHTSLNLIKKRIIEKFGYHPINVKTHTYFDFLYGFCIKPLALFKYNLKGISWDVPPDFTKFKTKENLVRYISKNGYLYHNRIGQFAEVENLIDEIKDRLEKFCDHLLFDEFQDLGGHDFNFFMLIVQAKINFLLVGDFYQNTYVTSSDGRTNSTLYSNLESYIKLIKKANINIDTNTLQNSHRCSPTICNYITQNLGIEIGSNNNNETEIFHITDKTEALKLIEDDSIIKLVYQESHKTNFYSKNWGDSKGEDDYENTCIILNKTSSLLHKKNKLIESKPRTKNRIYVAISRTKGNCYLIYDSLLK
ncbi:UvrD-helicase domain-containing protein [Wenyingzhuangia aestuarii]|uniref:UvrD-helicase domain-containing protein n=1 Tax=Wenyingzhuangia aestuarii TaxID=1647582 RepID=UPI00143BED35|nr:UvrD-helicase domain-containing protein [Wenyingzhuangia aestuarii]NJB84199.1 superfamily I DNA/RNA helicase [Wenyingzhuangia aestuarii]